MQTGAKYWLLCFLLQPFWLIFKYSSGTNYTRSGWLVRLTFLFLSGVTKETQAATFTAGVSLPEYVFVAIQSTFDGITGALNPGVSFSTTISERPPWPGSPVRTAVVTKSPRTAEVMKVFAPLIT